MVSDKVEREQAYEKALALQEDYAEAARALAELRGDPMPEWAAEPEVAESLVEEAIEEVVETARS